MIALNILLGVLAFVCLLFIVGEPKPPISDRKRGHITTKLAATEAIDTQMVMGVNTRTGQIEIAEYDGQIRGQMNLSDFTEEDPQPKEPAGQQEEAQAEAEREQDVPTGAPIDMRRRKSEPRQQAEAALRPSSW